MQNNYSFKHSLATFIDRKTIESLILAFFIFILPVNKIIKIKVNNNMPYFSKLRNPEIRQFYTAQQAMESLTKEIAH